jgi:hypothetical protein
MITLTGLLVTSYKSHTGLGKHMAKSKLLDRSPADSETWAKIIEA